MIELTLVACLLALAYPLVCLGGLFLWGAGAGMLTPRDVKIAVAAWIPIVIVSAIHSYRLERRCAEDEVSAGGVNVGRWCLFTFAEVCQAAAIWFLLLFLFRG